MTAGLSFAPRWILHPTDFSPESRTAFAHALAITLRTRGELTIIHVAPESTAGKEWKEFPSVRRTLAAWGRLPEASPKSALATDLGISVEKVDASSEKPLGAILNYVGRHPVDLMVLATHAREGIARWLHRPVAEPLARRARTMTLFVPLAVQGFVAPSTGEINLKRMLVPVARDPDGSAAVEIASALAGTMGATQGTATLLQVGDGRVPDLDPPVLDGWTWTRQSRPGEVVREIVAQAAEDRANAIVMTTKGHIGMLDALRGSTTERVVRQAPCPVLALPAI